MTGVEYAVVTAIPPRLFVIHKQARSSPTAGNCLRSVLAGCLELTCLLFCLLRSYPFGKLLRLGRLHLQVPQFAHTHFPSNPVEFALPEVFD